MWAKLKLKESPELNLLDAWAKQTLAPKAYFKSENFEILGWGLRPGDHENKNSEAADFEKLNNDLVMGAWRFDPHFPKNKRGQEWNSFGDAFVFKPANAILRKDGQLYFLASNSEGWESVLNSSLFSNEINQKHTPKHLYACPLYEQWQDEIEQIKTYFRTSSLEKLVLARKHVLSLDFTNKNRSEKDHFIENLFLSTAAGHSKAFALKINQHEAFISLTPERLFSFTKNQILIDCLAGTRPRGETPEKDRFFEDELMHSQKEKNEHQIVANRLNEIREKVGGLSHWLFKEKILKLKHVQHLYSLLAIENSTLPLSQWTSLLHPTPAVGGTPKEMAIKLIRELEGNSGFDRGLYAGPLGVAFELENETYADFLVGIRSTLVHENEMHVFGGCGIVPDSDADKEWEETYNKMKNFPQVEQAFL